MHRVDELLGRRRPGGDADGAGRSSGSSSAVVDPEDPGAAGLERPGFSSARVFDELAEPITTMASQRGAIASSADWRLVVAKHRSVRPGTHSSGKRLAGGVGARRPSRGG